MHRGFDLALTEVLDGDGHRFTVEVGSDEGAEVMAELPACEATPAESGAPDAAAERAAAQMGRQMEAGDLQELLQANLEHPRWDEVAERCLTCGNCTSVCPTCFCTTVEDVTDLTGQEAERNRRWDSCFTLDFTYVHGGGGAVVESLALPPVDDAQALDLVRPVRYVGLRGLRPLHHVVPGGHRHNRGGRRDPRDARRTEGPRCGRWMSS